MQSNATILLKNFYKVNNLQERLTYFIESYLDMTINKFSGMIGVDSQRLYKSMKPGVSPGSDFLEAIGTRYPELNLTWLITGKGEMLQNKLVASTVNEPETHYKLQHKNEQETEDCSKWKAEVERLTKERDALIEDNEILRDYFRMLKKKEKK